MSEAPVGLTIAEKLFGLLVIVLGIVVTYLTSSDPPEGSVSQFSGFFALLGLALIAIGIFLVLAKTSS